MWFIMVWISSVQFSHSVMSDCLQPHETLHARPPCPSPTPRDHSDPFPLCQWCHPTISSSVVPFSSCPQSFPASGSFQISQLSASGGQSIAVSPSTSLILSLWLFIVKMQRWQTGTNLVKTRVRADWTEGGTSAKTLRGEVGPVITAIRELYKHI